MKIKITKLLRHDYISFLFAFCPPFFIFVATFAEKFGIFPTVRGARSVTPEGIALLWNMGVISALIFIPLLILRINRFNSILQKGVKIKAKILRVNASSVGWLYTKFQYNFENEDIAKSMLLVETKATRSFKVGDEIDVIVERNKKYNSFIEKLYI